ncbi:hypothetical protein D3C76_765170 [compost metagenome]
MIELIQVRNRGSDDLGFVSLKVPTQLADVLAQPFLDAQEHGLREVFEVVDVVRGLLDVIVEEINVLLEFFLA